MKLYDGGSDKDVLIYETGDSETSTIPGDNQMFITFTTDGKTVDKGFTAKITFGKITIH